MRLDPVFVVGPKPASPSMPTRRAFLFAGGTFALGVSVGGACGYAVGVSAANAGESVGHSAQPSEQRPTTEQPAEADLKPSGDLELDEMRRLAVKAPIEELIEQRLIFVDSFLRNYSNDQILWRGLGRLCDAVLARADHPDRRRTAILLAQTIEFGSPGLKALLGDRARVLRGIR
jgi:hypothetical protein